MEEALDAGLLQDEILHVAGDIDENASDPIEIESATCDCGEEIGR